MSVASLQKAKKFFGEESFPATIVINARKSSLGDKRTIDPLAVPKPFHEKVADTLDDISVKQIREGGLEVLLKSTFPLFYFLAFCIQELTAENLLFVLEARDFRTCSVETSNFIRGKGQRLFEEYFESTGLLELNLVHKTKKQTKEMVENCAIDAFDAAVNEVKLLLGQSFDKFTNSDIFLKMVESLGEETRIRSAINIVNISELLENLYASQMQDERTVGLVSKARKLFWVTLGSKFRKKSNPF
jgi:hypothetical protein